MKVLVYSSFTFSYLNRARVLFKTLRRFHPDWELVALITDTPPQGFAFDPAEIDDIGRVRRLNCFAVAEKDAGFADRDRRDKIAGGGEVDTELGRGKDLSIDGDSVSTGEEVDCVIEDRVDGHDECACIDDDVSAAVLNQSADIVFDCVDNDRARRDVLIAHDKLRWVNLG